MSTLGRPGACIFCGAPASRKGEHGLPKWFVKRWTGFDFTRDLPDGVQRRTNHIEPILVPVCDLHTGNGCNQRLDTQYEAPGKELVRAVLDRGDALTSARDVKTFARWWIKTLLLLRHPAADTAADVPGWPIDPWQIPQQVYDDLLAGRIIDDLSLWVAFHDEHHGAAQLAQPSHVELWSTPDPASGRLTPATTAPGFSTAAGTGMFFMLVWHPRTNIAHPFEQAGLAVRLWPHPPSNFDPRTLARLSDTGLHQFRDAVVVGGGFADLEPGWRLEVHAVTRGDFQPPVFIAPDGTKIDMKRLP